MTARHPERRIGGALNAEHRRRILELVALAALTMTVGASCAATLPEPTLSRHPPQAFVQIPYPPPPSRVEWVPARPRNDAVWIDGEWQWGGSRWAWADGRWVVPLPPPAAYAKWVMVRRRDGSLLLASGAWRSASGEEVHAPAPLAVGRSAEESVIRPDGEIEPTAPNILPDTQTSREEP